MTFSEEAAELHRLEAVALSLGLTERAFEDILLAVVATAHASGKAPAHQLANIRQRVHDAADRLSIVRQGPRAALQHG
jgi:hypothetical protein